jgi:hypothetical protein
VVCAVECRIHARRERRDSLLDSGSGCGTNHSRTDKLDELFCNECNEKKPMSVNKEFYKYHVIIEVQGSIRHKEQDISVSGVTSRTQFAETKRDAERQGLKAFKDEPDYNTDISVDKDKMPSGRYLDDWSYNLSVAKANTPRRFTQILYHR